LQAEASNRVTTIANSVQIGMTKALALLSEFNKESVPETAVFNINKDFNASLMGSDGARLTLEAYMLGLLSTETFLKTLSDMELVDIGSAADEMLRIKEDTFVPIPKTSKLPSGTDKRLQSAANGGTTTTPEGKADNQLKKDASIPT